MTAQGPERIVAKVRAYDYDRGAQGEFALRDVAVEAPIEIAFGSVAFAVMMGTPNSLEDFAVGFALTEGIIEHLSEIRGVEGRFEGSAAKVNITLSADRMRAHLARKRTIVGRTGCGLCGVEDIDQLPVVALVQAPATPVTPASVGSALRALEAAQPLNAATRAVHGAAWCRLDGSLHLVREDVGRHNALDKCIGALFREGVRPSEGFLVITSRCSYEMVAKAARFGAGTLVSVSAPTSLALERAQECGVTLISIARSDHALSFDGGAG